MGKTLLIGCSFDLGSILCFVSRPFFVRLRENHPYEDVDKSLRVIVVLAPIYGIISDEGSFFERKEMFSPLLSFYGPSLERSCKYG